MSLAQSVRDWFEKLAPRERKMMSVFLAIGALFLLAIIPLATSALLNTRRADNKAIWDAITAIKSGREAVRLRQLKREAMVARYASRAPPLAGLLEKAARDNKLDVPESQDRPEMPHGKRYVERSTVVRLRKASMLQLARTLESLEQQRLPIGVTRLNVRRRGGEKDSYDIELGVSAFDRNEPVPSPTALPSGGGSAP